MADKVVYIGIFLDQETRKKLLLAVGQYHPEVHADHITLAFSPHEEMVEATKFMVGHKVPFVVDKMYHDWKGQAVGVVLPFLDFRLIPEEPHITISCEVGIAPKYSKELIKLFRPFALPLQPMLLGGVLDFFPRTVK
jgi:hypothetical protein